VDGKTQQPTAVNNGSYTSGIRSEGGNGPVKRFDNPKDAYNDSYNDVHAKLNGRSSWVNPSTSINQYINKYAPKEDNNDPVSYAQHAIKYFNKLLGTNNINLNSELGDIKDLLISKGYDPEHEFTKMHLQIEDPKVLADLGKNVNTKPEVKTQPIAQVNQEPKVTTNPTFTASPFAKPATKAEPKVGARPIVNKPATPVTSTKAAASPANTKFKEPRPDFTLPSVEVNWKQSASAVKWIYEAFGGSDEDKINVLSYLENGGSLSDVWDIYENYKAKKGGSENTDLIGESKSITSTTSDADKAIVNWGAPTLNISRESKAKSNYIIPKLKVADSPSVNKDEYTSKSFVANLKNKDNKFKVLNNIHANSGVGNIDSFYKNFQPVNGSIVFTMQNDVVSGQKPLTTITKDDKWYEGSQYLIKLTDDNSMEVTKTSSLKEGDQVFKLKNKVFSFEDFDIKDGKIKTVFDSNIGALIPVVKGDAKTYKSGSSFVIGLTDTNKTPGYIPIESASQYGKSRGGSFIVFNEDLTQQYMVGGSFKNLYDFYQDLKKQYPNSNFKVFSSDTGSYSNSFFPKSGQIDGNVYRKSNNRNTWGEVQHIVLMN
jgi:hypothetical protein